MPPKYVKTIEQLIFWEYAKLISLSAGFGDKNYGFIGSRWKKLCTGNIKMSSLLREWELERKTRAVCVYCGNQENIQTDHIIPKSKGGPNIPDNLIDSCQSCNIKKSNKDIFEFCTLLKIDMPRIVKGKILKLVYNEHEKSGTLASCDINGDGKLNLLDLCAIFKK